MTYSWHSESCLSNSAEMLAVCVYNFEGFLTYLYTFLSKKSSLFSKHPVFLCILFVKVVFCLMLLKRCAFASAIHEYAQLINQTSGIFNLSCFGKTCKVSIMAIFKIWFMLRQIKVWTMYIVSFRLQLHQLWFYTVLELYLCFSSVIIFML
jgi:hypothetical protein